MKFLLFDQSQCKNFQFCDLFLEKFDADLNSSNVLLAYHAVEKLFSFYQHSSPPPLLSLNTLLFHAFIKIERTAKRDTVVQDKIQ